MIILQPKRFLENIEKTIECGQFKHGEIQYFDYSITDIRMISYLLGIDGFLQQGAVFSQPIRNRYRHLLCKDKDFSRQKEYRIILDNECIMEPQKYRYKFDSEYIIADIDDLFNGISVKL